MGRPLLTVAIAIALTAGAAVVVAMGHQADDSLDVWVSAGGESAEQFRSLRERYGTDDYIVAAWAVADPDDKAELARAGNLAELLRKQKQVRQVWSPSDYPAWSLLRRTPMAIGNIVGRDGHTLAVAAQLDPAQRPTFPAMLAHVREQAESGIAAADRPLHWGGPPVVNAALVEASGRSLGRLMPAVAAVGATAVVLLLWSVRAAGVALLASGAATALAIAVQVLAGWPSHLILNIAPPLIFVLALSLALHVVAAVQSHGRSGSLARAARVAAVRRVVWPGTLAAATTLIGALSLTVAGTPPVTEFALVTVAGIAAAWVINLFALPALCVLLRVDASRGRRRGWTGKLIKPIRRSPSLVLAGFALIAIAAVAFLPRLHRAADPLSYLPPGHQLHKDYAFLESRLAGMTPFVLIVHGEDQPWDQVADWLREGNGWKVSKIEVLMPLDGAADECAVLGRIESGRAGELEGLAAGARGIAPNAQIDLTGTVPMILAAQRRILAGLAQGLIAVGVLFALLLAAIARRPLLIAAALVANAFPLLVCFGAMAAVDVPLDVTTAMIGSLLLGLAVDGTIHFVARYRRICGSRALSRSWHAVARPVTVTAMATAAAFAVFAVADFRPTALFGEFLAGGIVAAWAGDLFLLPAGIALLSRSRS